MKMRAFVGIVGVAAAFSATFAIAGSETEESTRDARIIRMAGHDIYPEEHPVDLDETGSAHIVVKVEKVADALRYLRENGVRILAKSDEKSLRISASNDLLRTVLSSDLISAAAHIPPSVKLKGFEQYSESAKRSTIFHDARVVFHENISFIDAKEILSRYGIDPQVSDYDYYEIITCDFEYDTAVAVAKEDAEKELRAPERPNRVSNQDSLATIQADNVQPGGSHSPPLALTGAGITIGEWDDGIAFAGHEQLSGVTTMDPSSFNYHATHVAGTMVVDGTGSAAARGFAYEGQLFSWDWSADIGEMNSESNSISLSNHSYGSIKGYENLRDFSLAVPEDGCPLVGGNRVCWEWWGPHADNSEDPVFGQYSSDSSDIDRHIFSNDKLVFWAAGNDRSDNATDNSRHFHMPNRLPLSLRIVHTHDHVSDSMSHNTPGFDSMTTEGCAKNTITVGAVESFSFSTTAFSNYGPCDDGRVKPDIVADGDQLWSAFYDPARSDQFNESNYNWLSGTSMATPSATGGAALILQHYSDLFGAVDSQTNTIMNAESLKGVILHTADDIAPAGPDYATGWGRMNVTAAVDLLSLHKQKSTTGQGALLLEDTIYAGEVKKILFAPRRRPTKDHPLLD